MNFVIQLRFRPYSGLCGSDSVTIQLKFMVVPMAQIKTTRLGPDSELMTLLRFDHKLFYMTLIQTPP